MKICSHETVNSFVENPMLLEAGLQKSEKGKKKKRFLASIDLECRSDEKL
jgi:hypothetical protein